jgi:hypothetical protein
MTERPDHDDDEIVSASIDGEATPAEAARVSSDPVLRARRTELEAAAVAVGGSVPGAPEAARERAIAAALDARGTEPATLAVVVPLRRRSSARWLAAAAAVALLAVGLGALLRRGSDSTTSTTAAPEAASSSSGPAGVASSSAAGAPTADSTFGAAAAGTPTTLADQLSARADLGSFATPAALAAALRSPTPAPTTAAGTVSGADRAAAPSTCPAPASLTAIDEVATATLAGQPVVVYVGTGAAGARAFVAVDVGCVTVAAALL